MKQMLFLEGCERLEVGRGRVHVDLGVFVLVTMLMLMFVMSFGCGWEREFGEVVNQELFVVAFHKLHHAL